MFAVPDMTSRHLCAKSGWVHVLQICHTPVHQMCFGAPVPAFGQLTAQLSFKLHKCIPAASKLNLCKTFVVVSKENKLSVWKSPLPAFCRKGCSLCKETTASIKRSSTFPAVSVGSISFAFCTNWRALTQQGVCPTSMQRDYCLLTESWDPTLRNADRRHTFLLWLWLVFFRKQP